MKLTGVSFWSWLHWCSLGSSQSLSQLSLPPVGPKPVFHLHPFLCLKPQFTINTLNKFANVYYVLFQNVNKWATRTVTISWLCYFHWLKKNVCFIAGYHSVLLYFSSLPVFSSSSLSLYILPCQYFVNYKQHFCCKKPSYHLSSGLAKTRYLKNISIYPLLLTFTLLQIYYQVLH